jgi:predicted 3-demethylubiquinone-9 3-methyltransferase (glyoxalase superfamily)
MQKIAPCLWFDNQGEEAANHHCSIFKNSQIVDVSYYGESGPGPAGSVLLVVFELDGQRFQALNGGAAQYSFNEALSLSVSCDGQDEVDYYWERLGDGGEPGPCGWLKDKYGVSWQVVPQQIGELLGDPDPERSQRAMQAMMQMGKIDIAELRRAADSA